MFKMQDLKKAVAIVADNCGIDSREASKIIGLFNTGRAGGVEVCEPSHDTISAILAGDVSGVPAACAVLGIEYKDKAPADNMTGDNSGSIDKAGDGSGDIVKETTPAGCVGAPAGSVVASDSASDKIPASPKKRNTSPNKKAATTKNFNTSQAREAGPVVESVNTGVNSDEAQVVPAASAEVVNDNKDELPAGFGDRCCEWVEAFCNKHNLDITHLKAQQWRSACMYVGENIKQSHVLDNIDWIKSHGGRGYSGVKLEKLLRVWAYLCGLYNQVPLVSDFINFSGVHPNYFYDYEGRGLSSSSVEIVKKARAIEESGLGSSVAGGGAGAVGGMFLLKTRHGYSETVTIQHAASAPAVGVAELPKLMDLGGGK